MVGPGSLIENAYVVRDLDKALHFWSTSGCAGPFFVGQSALPRESCTYRGAPTALSTRFAFGVTGGVAIELVQQLDDSPSVFKETLQERGEGLHHLKYATPSRQAEVERLAALGFQEVATLTIGAPDRVVSFVDTTGAYGVFMEIMDFAHWRPAYAALVKANAGWDGRTDPVRTWDRLAEYFDV